MFYIGKHKLLERLESSECSWFSEKQLCNCEFTFDINAQSLYHAKLFASETYLKEKH